MSTENAIFGAPNQNASATGMSIGAGIGYQLSPSIQTSLQYNGILYHKGALSDDTAHSPKGVELFGATTLGFSLFF